MNGPDTSNILKQVRAGAFSTSYVIYARKSTDEPENQKNSISYQKAETVA